MIDEMSPLALNVLPADLLAKELEAGRLKPRQPLPSESHLQQQYA